MTTYTTSQAARAAGISPATIRNHTRDPRLIPHFSPTAGANPRQLTTEDVRTLKYISTQTGSGRTLDDVAADLDAGRHLDATWSATDQQPQDQDQDQDPQRTLIDAALMTMLQTLRDEFSATRARADQLQDQLIDAERRAALAEAELTALKTARRSFWQRLTGR